MPEKLGEAPKLRRTRQSRTTPPLLDTDGDSSKTERTAPGDENKPSLGQGVTSRDDLVTQSSGRGTQDQPQGE